MRIRPIKSYAPPYYPQKDAVLADPDLLRQLPLRWQACRRAAAAAGLLAAMSFNGCSAGNLPAPSSAPPTATPTLMPTPSMPVGTVAPPVTVTEADALELINDLTAKRLRLQYSYDRTKIPKPVDVVTYYPDSDVVQRVKLIIGRIDAYDEKNHIGFEYYHPDSIWDNQSTFEWTDMDIEKPKQDTSYILFIATGSGDKQEAENRIQEQITGFLNWLKAEGIG